ncbi:MAG: two-component sensory box histidine kinase/response regulator [Bacteroidetes bacterium]|nr:MAG: two-component sensory box histidine kinase/response regulator [Bacteroidota bacterium]
METTIRQLIDFEKVDTLLEGFNKATGFVTAILDLEGNVLSKSGWRKMCTEFHRINPETSKNCAISDTALANKMGEGEKYHFYKCLNGLVDVAMPIVIKGEHIANLFSGQFFFEEPDISFFKRQAKQYGFDEGKYLAALKNVPVVSQEKVKTAMDFLLNMTHLISDMTFQKLEQIALNKIIREREEKFKYVFESANAAKSITLPTGEINVNQAFCKMLGYHSEELQKKKWQDITPSEEIESVQKELEPLLRGEKSATRFIKRYIHKDGTIVWGDVSVSMHYDSEKKPLYFITTIIDITERKLAEEKSQMSEANFRNLADSIQDGILIALADGRHIYANRYASELLGYTPEEMLKTTQKDLADPSAYPMLKQRLLDRIEGKPVPVTFETIIRRKDGTSFTAEVSGTPILWQGQKCDMVLFRDITARKQAEINLQNSEQKYRNLVENSLVGVLRSKVNGEIIYVNDAIVNMLEFDSREELISAGAYMRYKYPSQRDEFIRILKKDGQVSGFEANIVTKKGNEKILLYSLHLDGETIDGTLIDITDRKRIEKEIEDSQQFLKSVTSEVQEVIFAFDAQGIFTFSEGKGLEKLGLKPGEVVGMSVFDVYKDFPEILVNVKEALEGKVVKTGALKVGDLHFTVTYQPIFDENGRLISVVGLAVDVTDAKNAERALLQSKRQLATLMNNLAGMVYSCSNDQDWTMQFVSEGVLGLTGYLPDDLINNKIVTFEEIIVPEDRTVVRTVIQASLETRTSYDLEYRIVEKSGFIKYVWERGQGIFSENGELLNLEGFITDITDRRLAEDALQQANDMLEKRVLERTVELARSNKLLDETGSLARVGGWEIDLLTGINYWSKATRIIHEVEPDFDPNLELSIHFYAPEYIPFITGLVDRLINFGEPFDTELELITAKKNRIWVRALGQPFYEDGKIVRIGGVFQDINQRKLADIELKKHREHLEELVEDRTKKLETHYALLNALINSPVDMQIFSLDSNYCYTAFNEKHRQQVKKTCTTDIQIGANILECGHISENWLSTKSSIDRVLNGEVFTEVQHQPNADIYYELNWNPIFKEKEIVGVTVFVHDISERKRTENEIREKNEELQKLNATKDKFFSIIAHDLKSPFSSFLGLTQVMAEDLPNLTMDQIQYFALTMSKSATHLYRLLENLLQWSRMQQGAIPFNPEMIELNRIVDESIEMIQEPAKMKGIEIITHVPEGLSVFADTNLLQTIIRNLVSNALKYTTKEGKVSVLAKTSDEKKVEICIQDSGIGMSKAILEKLFRIDIQTNRKGTEGEPSTGLGLILCKEFVEKQGGKLWVESEENKGSVFHFTLPLVNQLPKEPVKLQAAPSEQKNDVRKLKILIAEDDEISEMLINSFIKSFGKEILKARTGVETVEMFRANQDIDMILMDIRMPLMNGYEATKQIREINKDVVIIAQTAYGLPGDKKKSIESGCNDYITKPLSKAVLDEVIHKYFGGKV